MEWKGGINTEAWRSTAMASTGHPGIDLNVQGCPKGENTALHCAVFNNDPAIVSQLLRDDKMGASLHDCENMTALKMAIVFGHPSV